MRAGTRPAACHKFCLDRRTVAYADIVRCFPRFHFHFTPTSASWLNAVEGFFAKLSRQRLKRGVFKGIVDLQAAINRYVVETNDNPKPFVWTADPDAIIEKVRRGKRVLAATG